MRLRPHQQEALAAILAAAGEGRRRMTVVAASGSGKTLIAQRSCAELAPQGATLVLVPTKALVVQTARKWREAGYRGLLIGVCSLSQDDSGLSSWELTMTSDPATIAARVAGHVRIGAWLAKIRTKGRAGQLPPDREALVAALFDGDWTSDSAQPVPLG
ncbi:helicase associated domain-containing protein [Streptomyces niveus]|uniref:DEAD/DEAH box helicase family protein n=1 Tax=Streptomyces niveus TaxID=193462 RepID=A0ABZ2AEK1_STRNV|nr:DEAD/DEAH box helicase family protein [Streptomyces niveus]